MMKTKRSLPPGAIDLTGVRFGRLVALSHAGTARSPTAARSSGCLWKCRCDCGEIVVKQRRKLTSGKTKSCGCLRRQVAAETSHKTRGDVGGASRSPEYNTYYAMIARCYDPEARGYQYYGGRGISVCDRWLAGRNRNVGFRRFFEDMGLRPSDEYSIDRIDVNGNYEPSNCRWATREIQANNKRRSLPAIVVDGERVSIAQASRKYGVSYGVLRARIKSGVPPDEAVRMPVKKRAA